MFSMLRVFRITFWIAFLAAMNKKLKSRRLERQMQEALAEEERLAKLAHDEMMAAAKKYGLEDKVNEALAKKRKQWN